MDWKYLKNPFVVITDTAGKTTDLILQHVFMMKESEKVLQIAETSLLDELGVKTKKNSNSIAKIWIGRKPCHDLARWQNSKA